MIRPAVEADLPALLALYAELHPDDPPLPVERGLAIWRRIENQQGRTILVAETGGVVTGTTDCSVLHNLTRGGRPFMLVENVVVAASWRRTGVASRLFEAVIDLAVREDCYKVQLISRSDRVDAHSFYESCGFEALAEGYRRYFR
ncbi:GNAT family N-acetyltransferase [Amycolatopsis sp. WAC 01375]|uniref:GNAT family N-acetyltransferase n=1 Tax=Amycolatopsis sp. WAC 01375 TaxID=2203194 RepID=UPI000F7A6C62|nr:GNAT family N-acetyltransferase [Amycolatopsis sp. WAC 01375]RSM84024.1 GNAT family N-acetyltransferase [Amycolatopsis sp. WAC 01375]